jgi:uridine kinase
VTVERAFAAFDDVVRDLASRPGPLVVGIDGAGGAGKSTFAAALVGALPDAVAVALDDYILKEHMADLDWELGWDRRRLAQEVLEPFRAGRPAAVRRLEWDTNTLSEPVPLGAARILIIEGITAFHPELADHLDYRIWVETPASLALQRGKTRDAGNENEGRWDAWAENDRRYRERHHPDASADAIVDGTAPGTVPA